MELFNKIGEIAKQTAEKANDALEVSKLNAKIRAERRNIEGLKIELGNILWTKYSQGQELDDEAKSICQSIKECMDAIDALNDAIGTIRQERRPEAAQSCDTGVGEVDPTQKACSACGESMPRASRFCGHCGAMQED